MVTAMELLFPLPETGLTDTQFSEGVSVQSAPSGMVRTSVSEPPDACTVAEVFPWPSVRVMPPVPPVPSSWVTERLAYTEVSPVRYTLTDAVRAAPLFAPALSVSPETDLMTVSQAGMVVASTSQASVASTRQDRPRDAWPSTVVPVAGMAMDAGLSDMLCCALLFCWRLIVSVSPSVLVSVTVVLRLPPELFAVAVISRVDVPVGPVLRLNVSQPPTVGVVSVQGDDDFTSRASVSPDGLRLNPAASGVMMRY